MGALRVNLTDGTSAYIDLSSALSVEVASSEKEQFTILVGGVGTYQVKRFETANPEDGTGENSVVWPCQMEVAYGLIASNPIKYGYPRLGTDPNTYIQYDDEKFLAAAIDSALSNTGEPAVLSNRTARAHQITTCTEGSDALKAISKITEDCVAEADTLFAACEKAVVDPACEGGFNFGGIICDCGDTACCEATKITYIQNCVDSLIEQAGLNFDIRWDHQYLFQSIQLPESE